MTEEPVAKEEVTQEKPPSTGGGALSRIARVLFRVLVAVVVGLALGVGLYFGAIRLYRETIEPIQNYEDRISELEQSMEEVSRTLTSENGELKDRQVVLEGRLAEQVEALASVEALVNATQQDMREQRRTLEAVADLQSDMEDVSRALGDLSLLVGQLESDVAAGDLPAQRVQRTVVYLRAMTLLTRAQLELDRDNLGFAAAQVEAAKAAMNELILMDAQSEVQYADAPLINLILERLEVILADLPGRPGVAGAELEAVWGLFVEAVEPIQLADPETGGE